MSVLFRTDKPIIIRIRIIVKKVWIKMEKNIANRLKIGRIRLGFKNQTEFAEKIGIKQGSLSKYERGINEIPDEVKVKLGQLGLNIHWLVTGEGDLFTDRTKLSETIHIVDNIEKIEHQLSNSANIADEIKAIRNNLGKTQGEIADILGIPRSTWVNYETGITEPPLKIKMKLADLESPRSNLSNNIMLGGNITQNIGDNNTNITASTKLKQGQQDSSNEDSELVNLICNYAPPKLKQELREKLLKIKELSDTL